MIDNPTGPFITPDAPRTTGLGYIPDIPDQRDHLFSAPQDVINTLPPSISLRADMPTPQQQLQLSSCTSFGIGYCFQYDQKKQGLPVFIPSHLYLYYFERQMENSINSDSGAMIRDGIQVVATKGLPPEDLWPYTTSNWNVAPSQSAIDAAVKHEALAYKRVSQDLQSMRACLASGFPFVVGISVYENFMSDAVARTGMVNMPQSNENMVGGHCVAVCGYNDEYQRFTLINSWGTNWGDGGFFTLPYSYLLESYLASDMWMISSVE